MSDIEIPDKAITSIEGIESFFEREEAKLEEIEGDEILERSFGVIMFYNSLSDTQKVGILEKLLKYLRKLKEKLDGIAKDWGVSSYTVSVSWTGISLSLTFET